MVRLPDCYAASGARIVIAWVAVVRVGCKPGDIRKLQGQYLKGSVRKLIIYYLTPLELYSSALTGMRSLYL